MKITKNLILDLQHESVGPFQVGKVIPLKPNLGTLSNVGIEIGNAIQIYPYSGVSVQILIECNDDRPSMRVVNIVITEESEVTLFGQPLAKVSIDEIAKYFSLKGGASPYFRDGDFYLDGFIVTPTPNGIYRLLIGGIVSLHDYSWRKIIDYSIVNWIVLWANSA